MLETLNRCLYGRLQGGFVTAVLLRLEANGNVTLANAGHLPPFLNQRELEIEGSLPLGLLPSAPMTKYPYSCIRETSSAFTPTDCWRLAARPESSTDLIVCTDCSHRGHPRNRLPRPRSPLARKTT